MTKQGRFRLKLLGNFQLFDPSGREIPLTNKRGKALIAFLALSEDFSANRSELYNNLWDSGVELVGDKRLQERLRSCIRYLKQSLGPERYGDLIETGVDSTLRLRQENVNVDICDLRSRLDTWMIREDIDFLELLGSGNILGQFEQVKAQTLLDWVDAYRADWKTYLCTRLKSILDTLVNSTGHSHDPIRVGSLLLKLDPCDESVHRLMMRLYAQQGNKAAAKQQYETCERVLRKELDVTPTEKTKALMESIAKDRIASDTPEIDIRPIRVVNSLGPTSIAVLPFECPASSEQSKVLQVGICQGLIASLSRISEFTVIDYSSVIGLTDNDQPLPTLRESLGVEFLLTGTIRGDNKNLRVTINLSRSANEKVIWGKSYSSSQEEVFKLEDHITEAVAGELEPGLIQQAIKSAFRAKPHNLSAYEWTLRAVPGIYKLDKAQFNEARVCLEKALEIDPKCAPAHTWLAFWYAFNTGQNWGVAQEDLASAHHHARMAIDLDTDDARAYAIAGHLKGFLFGELEAGEQLLNRAISLNKNSGFAWAFSAINQCYLGHPEECLNRMKIYKRLCPLDPYSFFFETINCIAHTLLEDYEVACQWGRRTVDRNIHFANGYKPFLASLGHLERTAEADVYRDRLLALEPDFSVRKFRENYHLRDRSMMLRYCEGLHKAGVPLI